MATITTNVAPITITRGDTVIHRVTVLNTDSSVKDITGATVRYTIRERLTGETQILQKTVGAGVQLTTPLSGILDVTLDPADTAVLVPGRPYSYDCEVTHGGQVSTVQTGSMTVVKDVSY